MFYILIFIFGSLQIQHTCCENTTSDSSSTATTISINNTLINFSTGSLSTSGQTTSNSSSTATTISINNTLINFSTGSSSSTSGQTTLRSTTLFVANVVTNIFWVQTVLNTEFTENLTNLTVTTDFELRLSNAYNVGYNRVIAATRKKRAATNGVNTLYLVGITRPVSTQKSTVLQYYVQAPDFVAPSTVVTNMNKLSLQEMSIIMGRPVTIVAQLNNAASQSLVTDNKLWIFGAVFGSLAGAAVLIWLVLFIHRRCLIPFDEPLLAEKSSVDLESQIDKEKENPEANELDTIMPNLYKVHYSETPSKYVRTQNYEDEASNSQYDSLERSIEQGFYGHRVPQEIIVKHVYENNENKNHSEYRRQINTSYGSRRNSRIYHSGKKKHRKKRKMKINENNIEIKSDIQEQQSASLQASELSVEENFENMRQYLDLEVESNLIVVKSLENETLSKESIRKPTDNKTEEDKAMSLEDDNVLYPSEFVDTYPYTHIYPIYSNQMMLPDTTLNLVQSREITQVERDKQNIDNINAKKRNMRTLDSTSVKRSNEL